MLIAQAAADKASAPQALLTASIAIILFAAMRGIFAFLQTFWAEKNSQAMAFDMRNDLFAKVQRLSFSYHDRNQTGQLMVRATDDVEKVRLFIAGSAATRRRDHPAGRHGSHHLLYQRLWPGRPCRSCRCDRPLCLRRHCSTTQVPRAADQALFIEHDPAGKPGRDEGHPGVHARKTAAAQVPRVG
jgi:ABC-type multidrug transport system fused ATPase/permease subunit